MILVLIGWACCVMLLTDRAHLQVEPEAEYEFLGRFRTVIVGIRYYTGRVGSNEVGVCHHVCANEDLGLRA